MSITGTGTIDDPYVVTTWAELSEKASQSSKYVKLGNNINALDEYPNGDIPRITLNAIVDGDGKTISNIYSKNTISTDGIFSISSGELKNIKLKNIYSYQPVFSSSTNITSTRKTAIIDCEISGVCKAELYKAGSYACTFQRCSINVESNSYLASSGYPMLLSSCYIRFRSTAEKLFKVSNGPNSSTLQMLDGCYVEANMPDLLGLVMKEDNSATFDTAVCFDNSVLDITTEAEFTVGYSAGTRATSILRSAHAADITAEGNIAAVDETHWLDAAYLRSLGFSIEVGS